MDECTENLSKKAKEYFVSLGSTEIWNLSYRQGFAFIGVHGKADCQEKRAINLKDSVSVTRIFQCVQKPRLTNEFAEPDAVTKYVGSKARQAKNLLDGLQDRFRSADTTY